MNGCSEKPRWDKNATATIVQTAIRSLTADRNHGFAGLTARGFLSIPALYQKWGPRGNRGNRLSRFNAGVADRSSRLPLASSACFDDVSASQQPLDALLHRQAIRRDGLLMVEQRHGDRAALGRRWAVRNKMRRCSANPAAFPADVVPLVDRLAQASPAQRCWASGAYRNSSRAPGFRQSLTRNAALLYWAHVRNLTWASGMGGNRSDRGDVVWQTFADGSLNLFSVPAVRTTLVQCNALPALRLAEKRLVATASCI